MNAPAERAVPSYAGRGTLGRHPQPCPCFACACAREELEQRSPLRWAYRRGRGMSVVPRLAGPTAEEAAS